MIVVPSGTVLLWLPWLSVADMKGAPMVTLTERYPDLLKSSEMACYLRISKSTLYRLVRNGRLPVARVGGRLRFRRDAVCELLSDSESGVREIWPFTGEGGRG